jgi:ubiquinone/menaquinone biosynthesis C-methylase UbiE
MREEPGPAPRLAFSGCTGVGRIALESSVLTRNRAGLSYRAMAKKYTVLETWIVNETKPEGSSSAEQTYERMAQQGGGKLPVIDVPQDFREENHFYDEARIRDYVAHLAGADEVLDIGPGDGWPLLRIAPFFKAVTGVDPSEKRVAVTQANAEKLGLPNVTLKQMSATKLDFPDNSFGGAVANSSIEQTADPFQALSEVFRVLRPGAKFRVSFEPFDRLDRGFSEDLFLTETDDSYGYHYVLKHHRPPWERNYMVKFNKTEGVKEGFAKLTDLIDRLGPNPSQNPELGLQFLERLQADIAGSTWYELEHFTSMTMKETLEEVGFTDVRIAFSAAVLARTMWSRIRDSDLTEDQTKHVLQGLADVAVRMDAPAGIGEPVVATKPN